MSCYICLKSKGKMMEEHGGCVCKGSLKVHTKCFSKMCYSSPNPFTCSICKSDLSAKFLEKFIGMEKIMMHRTDEEEYEEDEYEDISEWYEISGMLIEEINGELYFQSEREMYLYIEYQKRKFLSQKYKHAHYQRSQKIRNKQPRRNLRNSFKKSHVRVRL
jgi:hypothetical protein